MSGAVQTSIGFSANRHLSFSSVSTALHRTHAVTGGQVICDNKDQDDAAHLNAADVYSADQSGKAVAGSKTRPRTTFRGYIKSSELIMKVM